MQGSKKFIKIGEAEEKTGLSRQTLRRYALENKIEFITTPSGHRLFNVDSILKKPHDEEQIQICYCRVSTHNQKDDLARQVAYMKQKYPEYTMVTDVGSGINFKRPGLKKIIDLAVQGLLKKLVIAYKDRLCRIGYDLIEHILTTYSNTEIIIDHEKTETLNEEIANDILQIINVYSAKINGMRKYKTVGNEENTDVTESDSEHESINNLT